MFIINKIKLVYIKLTIIILILGLCVIIYLKYKTNIFENYTNNVNNNENNENNKNDKHDFIKSFTNVYDTNTWGDNNNSNYKGSSGPGSNILYNDKTYIPFMHKFLEEYKIKSVVDLGCGDFVIGLLLYGHKQLDYTGYDAYKGVVDYNTDKFKENNKFKFIHSDFTSDTDRINLKSADLCVIKDVLQHLPTKTITNFMDFIIKSKKYKYILIINCYNTTPENTDDSIRKDINPGDFSSLSALRHPLKQYNAKVLYTWDTKEISLIEV